MQNYNQTIKKPSHLLQKDLLPRMFNRTLSTFEIAFLVCPLEMQFPTSSTSCIMYYFATESFEVLKQN